MSESDSDVRCPKCGGEDFWIAWKAKDHWYGRPVGGIGGGGLQVRGEHMLHTCVRCDWIAAHRPLDFGA